MPNLPPAPQAVVTFTPLGHRMNFPGVLRQHWERVPVMSFGVLRSDCLILGYRANVLPLLEGFFEEVFEKQRRSHKVQIKLHQTEVGTVYWKHLFPDTFAISMPMKI